MNGGTAARRAARLAGLLSVLAGSLAGCSALGSITGAVAGAASGTASGNPGVAIVVAISVKTAIDAAQKKFDRYWQHEQQQSIAAQIGALPVGAQGPWQVRHIVPYEDRQGRVQVLRAFSTPLADCKEALFTVEPEENTADSATAQPSPPLRQGQRPPTQQQFFTTVCRDAQGWQWALAEPAVRRWGKLH